jgi:crotonobetainyl-CoA:carnitine CoA-transferase CaiB-like acyl-CoA transferase
MPELTVLMDEMFATRTLGEWGRLFDDEGFIWGPGATVAEFAADRQADADELYPTISHPDVGELRTVASPVRIEGADIAPRGPAPEIGQHTSDVLTELGLPAEELRALAADGIISGLGLPVPAPD